jgi:hypothetical protein
MYQCYGIKRYTHKEKLWLKKTSYLQDRKNTHTVRCGNTSGQECHTKKGTKESKIQEFMWNMKCMVIPVINGVTEIVTNAW